MTGKLLDMGFFKKMLCCIEINRLAVFRHNAALLLAAMKHCPSLDNNPCGVAAKGDGCRAASRYPLGKLHRLFRSSPKTCPIRAADTNKTWAHATVPTTPRPKGRISNPPVYAASFPKFLYTFMDPYTYIHACMHACIYLYTHIHI